jgi:hypothetical protein
MKKSYTQRLASQIVTLVKKQTTKKVGLLAGLFLVFGLAAFSQTNYYIRTDSFNTKTGAQVRPDLTSLKAWTTTGTAAGFMPSNFTDDGQIFNIQTNGYSTAGYTSAKKWKVSGNGSKVVVGSDTANVTFTLQYGAVDTATFDVLANATLYLQLSNTSTITWGTLATGSTVRFGGTQNGYQQVLPGSYYNLSLASAGGAYLQLVLPEQTIHVAGTFTSRGSDDYLSTIDFNGTGQHIPSGNYYNLTVSGTSDSLAGTIYVAGQYTISAPVIPFTYSPTTGLVVASTVNYNGLNVAGQTLGNSQAYYNLTFSNGRSFIVTGFNYDSSYITLAQEDGDLAIGDSVSAASTIFPSLTSAAIAGFGATSDTVYLTLPPALRLIVHPAGGGADTVSIASYSVADSTLTLTAPATFAAGDTLYASQILTAPTVTKGVVTNAAILIVAGVSGTTVQLASSKAFSAVLSTPGLLNGTLSFGTHSKLPTDKTIANNLYVLATFTPGKGNITTTGSTVNYIGKGQGVAGGTNFYYNNLVVNQIGGAQATLSAAALVKGSFLLNGKLATNNATRLLTLDVNATIAPANDTSFVDGYLAKNFASTTPFTYPIGALVNGAAAPRTVTITPNTADAKTYRAYYTTGKVNYSTAIKNTIDAIDTLSYYSIALSNYTAGVDTSAQLTFEYVPDAFTLDSTITLAHFYHNNFNADATPQTVSSATTPLYFTTYGYDTLFGNYAFATASAILLPVKIGALVATELANKTVKVSWESYSETNVSNYVVESSTDGVNFTAIGSLPAKGASEYSFIDVNPKQNLNYYRVKIISNIGAATYTGIVSVKIGAIVNGTISVYPNPVANKQLNFALNTDAATYSLKVTNVLGQTVMASTINHAGGTASYSLSLPSSLATGTYFVKLSNGLTELNKTIIVQ